MYLCNFLLVISVFRWLQASHKIIKIQFSVKKFKRNHFQIYFWSLTSELKRIVLWIIKKIDRLRLCNLMNRIIIFAYQINYWVIKIKWRLIIEQFQEKEFDIECRIGAKVCSIFERFEIERM